MTAMRYRTAYPRRRRVLTLAAVGGALSLAGTGVVWLGHSQSRPTPVSALPAQTARLPGRAAARSEPSASAPPSSGLPRAADLAKLTWTDFYGVQLPASASAGPRHQRGGLASGYTDTPLGALLAAVNIAVRANAQWGPGIYTPTIRHQVTGPGATALLAACRSTYRAELPVAGVRSGAPLGRAYVSEEAFRWVTYTPAAATVDLVSSGPGPAGTTVRAVTEIEVTWSDGDWRVIAPLGGDWGNSATRMTSLNGYTTFPIPTS